MNFDIKFGAQLCIPGIIILLMTRIFVLEMVRYKISEKLFAARGCKKENSTSEVTSAKVGNFTDNNPPDRKPNVSLLCFILALPIDRFIQ